MEGVGVGLDKSHFVHGTMTVTVFGPSPQPYWHTLVVMSQPYVGVLLGLPGVGWGVNVGQYVTAKVVVLVV